jgi:hypothetical protein
MHLMSFVLSEAKLNAFTRDATDFELVSQSWRSVRTAPFIGDEGGTAKALSILLMPPALG